MSGQVVTGSASGIVRFLQNLLDTRGVGAYLVGGFLRDSLLGIPTNDIDIAVDGDAAVVALEIAEKLGGKYIALDEVHQIARVVVAFGDDEWWVDIARLQGTLEQDLGRRDFTIDAMALPLSAWAVTGWQEMLLDPFGGRRDVERRVIRVVWDTAFVEDPVRLLRGPRLSAKLGFDLDSYSRALIYDKASLLVNVSMERVRDEFLGIIGLTGAKLHLELLDSLGLLTHVVPELEMARGVGQPREHFWDVFDHSLQSVAAAEHVLSGTAEEVPWDDSLASYFNEVVSDSHTRRTLLKLAALLHDVAKPLTKSCGEDGRTHFFGHQVCGASIAETILERLRLSRRGIHLVSGMVEHHLRPTQMSQGVEMPTPRAVYRYFRDAGDVAIDTLYLCLADYLAAKGPALVLDDWQRHARIIRHILQMGVEVRAPSREAWLVNGHELVALLGLPPSAFLGEVLNAVHEAQAVGDVTTKDEALAWACKYVKSKKPGDGLARKNS
jgi:poly(A) polymerase